ncbi:hypothetical protein [Sphingobacterium siyangense]|uniref:hypothetical protein n=1 Tax=Sphingobacterium siyangense TaxID=459529 RepID=UPI003DA62C74
MNDDQIKEILLASLSNLQNNDSWLLTKNLSEQSVSHKLAEYLQRYLNDYNVDCEYNGDIDDPNSRKHIAILRNQLELNGLLSIRETRLEREIIERAVFPDIIVHKRGNNKNNLLIIEVKKASSNVPFDYDRLKLIAYTTSEQGNHLKYQLGAFIVINESGNYIIEYYKDGIPLNN